MKEKAEVVEAIDLKYKNGFVECVCGWRKELGDGFNGYKIDCCPSCDKTLATRIQTTVTTGSKGNYKVQHGTFVYFVITSNNPVMQLHIQYKANVFSTEYKR